MYFTLSTDYFVTDYHTTSPPGAVSAVLEDTIMHKGRRVTAGSKIIEDFISPLDATVVTRLEAAGVRILGKTKMDEFGVAGLFPGFASGFSGAVDAVADGVATFALCNDLTGAVRRQAVSRGVCYIHPTYGTVSRFGLIHAASSMDQIGVVCRTPGDGFYALSVISGNDPKDGAMFPDNSSGDTVTGDNRGPDVRNPGSGNNRGADVRNTETGDDRGPDVRNTGPGEAGNPSGGAGKIRIARPLNVFAELADTSAIDSFLQSFKIIDFELEYFEVFSQVMQILCCAEISSNLTRYDGIKFGYRASGFRDLHELYTKSRTEALGADVKLTALVGSMALSQEYYGRFYDKSMRIRRLIKQSLDFGKYDAIIMPVFCDDTGLQPALHALPQLCGLPAVSIPLNSGGASSNICGVSLFAGARREDILISALKAVSK